MCDILCILHASLYYTLFSWNVEMLFQWFQKLFPLLLPQKHHESEIYEDYEYKRNTAIQQRINTLHWHHTKWLVLGFRPASGHIMQGEWQASWREKKKVVCMCFTFIPFPAIVAKKERGGKTGYSLLSRTDYACSNENANVLPSSSSE